MGVGIEYGEKYGNVVALVLVRTSEANARQVRVTRLPLTSNVACLPGLLVP